MKQIPQRAWRNVVRGTLLVLAVAAATGWAGPQVRQTEAKQSVTLLPEVRLRKLHLVRPDLIPYPICYEVCC